jgi:HEPN domain-containing protein
MRDPITESERWWRQAQSDFQTAEVLMAEGEFSACAFHAQQASEKAMKAVLYVRGLRPFGHSLTALLARAEQEGFPSPTTEIEEAAAGLDKHYISARYPDAFEEQIPAEYYTHELAEEALAWATLLLQYSGASLPYLKNDSGDNAP